MSLKWIETSCCVVLIICFSLYIADVISCFQELCLGVLLYGLFALVLILFDVEGNVEQQWIESIALSLLMMYLLFFVCQ